MLHVARGGATAAARMQARWSSSSRTARPRRPDSAGAGGASAPSRPKDGPAIPARPWYVNEPLVSDAVCEDIFKLHNSDPGQYTVRRLASDFQMRLARVRAIITLKTIEHGGGYAENVLKATRAVTKLMEETCGVRPRNRDGEVFERSHTSGIDYVALDESGTYDMVLAAAASATPRPVKVRSDPDARPPGAWAAERATERAAKPTVLGHDASAANKRFDLQVIEVGPNENDSETAVRVRQRDGALVRADAMTRRRLMRLVQPRFNPVELAAKKRGEDYHSIDLSRGSNAAPLVPPTVLFPAPAKPASAPSATASGAAASAGTVAAAAATVPQTPAPGAPASATAPTK